jgi:hypothetical protein
MFLGTVYVATKFQPESDFKYGRQAAILENQQRA